MLLTRAAIAGILVAALSLVATGAVWAMKTAEDDRAVAPEPVRTPVEVVAEWDQRRAVAWAGGDTEGLQELYVPGVKVGRDDVEMLDAYLERGLRVQGLTTQLLAVDELRVDEEEMVLKVTDRVHGGTVVGPGISRSLPRDGVSVRRLTFHTHEGTWKVFRVVEESGGQAG